MTRYIHVLTICAIVFLGIFPQKADAQPKAQDVIKMLQKRYETLNDFTADLLHIQEFAFSGAKDTTLQVIALLKSDYFKIETSDIIIVTDGKIVKDYSIYEQKVTIDEVDSEAPNSFLPREFLFEFPERFVPADFRPEIHNGKTVFVLAMEPKKPDEEFMQTLEVWIDPADSLVKYVRYTDFNDNENIYLLNNYKIDIGLSPENFELQIPEGVTVKTVDLRRKKE